MADAWGTNTSATGATPDAAPHTFCFRNGDATFRDRVRVITANTLVAQTKANAPEHTSCNLSGTSETDAAWANVSIGGGVRGETYCEDFDGGVCDQNYINIDSTAIAGQTGPTNENVRKTICHELGHSVGLTHGSTYGGCMVSGSVTAALTWRRYSDHHVNHINAWAG